MGETGNPLVNVQNADSICKQDRYKAGFLKKRFAVRNKAHIINWAYLIYAKESCLCGFSSESISKAS